MRTQAHAFQTFVFWFEVFLVTEIHSSEENSSYGEEQHKGTYRKTQYSTTNCILLIARKVEGVDGWTVLTGPEAMGTNRNTGGSL